VTERSPPGPPGGTITGVLDRVLGYVNSPFRLVAIVVLTILGIVAYTVWEKRAEIAEAVLHHTITPRLEPGEFAKLAPVLMNETRADVVVLIQIELYNNVGRTIAGIARDDPGWKPSPAPRPVLIDGGPARVVRLIEGGVECYDITADNPHPTAREAAALGITRACAIGVPPVVDVLVGGLFLGWKTALSEPEEAGIKRAMYRVALKLATW
jgi:hypothetical protein